MRPKWLITLPDGKLMIEKSIENFNIKIFHKIYIVVLKEHLKKYVEKKKSYKKFKKKYFQKN